MAERGMRYFKRRKYARALHMFEKALPLRPKDPELLGLMVKAAVTLGRKDRVLLYGLGYVQATSDPTETPDTDILGILKKATSAVASKAVDVVIETVPAAVRVTIDHVSVGRTPLARIKLLPGRYSVRAYRSGFEDAHDHIVVVAGKPFPSKTITMVAQNRKGSLAVKTVPASGVIVSVDGRRMGVTPLRRPLVLTEGKRLVVFHKPGYDLWQRYVRIRESRMITLEPILERQAK